MEKSANWRPYLTGALVGVIATLSVVTSNQVLGKTQYLGASTTFVRGAGFIEQSMDPAHVAENPYFNREKVRIDWQFMLVIGIFIGALGAALVDGSFRFESVPPIWRERFGNSIGVRAGGAFVGGLVAMFGARLADGCPSGHGLSGLMQLSVSGFIALACFFGAGVLMAALVYGGKRGAQ